MPTGKEQKGIGKHFVQTFNYFTSFAVWAAQGYVFVWSHQTFRALLFFLLQLAHCIHSMELYSTDIHRCELWSSRFRDGGWYKKKKIPKYSFLCLQTQILKHYDISQPLPQHHCRLDSKFLPGKKHCSWPPAAEFPPRKTPNSAYTFPVNNSALCNAHEHVRFVFLGDFLTTLLALLSNLHCSLASQPHGNPYRLKARAVSPFLQLHGGALMP